MLNFFKKSGLRATGLKIDLAFQFHKSASNALVLYNLGSKPIRDITLIAFDAHNKKFYAHLKQINPKIGELIKLSDCKDESGLVFEGNIAQVHIIIRGRINKFERYENKFIQA
jgi:hypothetical protein